MIRNRQINLWASLFISVTLMSVAAAPRVAGHQGPAAPPAVGRAVPAAPPAPTFNVNVFTDAVANFADDPDYTICQTVVIGACTLRAAIMNANRFAAGGATINLPVGTQVLSLTPAAPYDDSNGDLNISNTVTIIGAGARYTIVDGGGIDRVFNIGASATVSITGITIQHGQAAIGGGLRNMGNLILNSSILTGNRADVSGGGGILNDTGSVTLNTSTVSANTSENSGGGILNGMRLTLNNSTVNDNVVLMSSGGGIGNFSAGTVTLNNSTVSGNSVSANGGGIYINSGVLTVTNSTIANNSSGGGGAGVYVNDQASFFQSTITGNLADRDGSGFGSGGGIYNSAGQVQLWNTLLAENYISSTANECGGDPLTSRDYNLFRTTSGCTISGAAPHDVTGGDAWLGPLQDNGGQTFTRALWVGSPAIDQIPPVQCRDQFGDAPVPDQRGVTRPVGPKCDIGAYEGAQPTPLFNRNLIRNGDAENAAGSPTGAYVGTPNWLVTAGQFTAVPYNAPGGFPSVPTDTVPVFEGYNFFAGGNAPNSVASQAISVSAASAAIDAGGIHFTLSGDLGGYLDQADNATLKATFQDETLLPIGSPVTIGPVTPADRCVLMVCNLTGFQHRSATGVVPPGTRTIRVAVTMTAVSGPYNDGYADNLSLVLTPPFLALSVFLPLVLR